MGGFVIVDGIDGSGKGVMMQSFREWAGEKSLRTLDLREYFKETSNS